MSGFFVSKNIYIAIVAVVFIIVYYLYLRQKNEGLSEDCSKPDVVVIDSGVPGPIIGMVGSVHGNEPAGAYTLSRMIELGDFKPRKGKLIIIRRANPCGLARNIRENPWTGNDTNRQFNENGGMDSLSSSIVNILEPCDLIIDFHEGWGWYLETIRSYNPFQPVSVGSTITPGTHEFWQKLAPKIVNNINQHIDNDLKKFSIIWGASCKIPSSLNCYALQNNRPYVLVETSGQNDIQPIEAREQQNRIIIETILSHFRVQ